MEEKEIKIQVPEGYEIDEKNSTFECIKFKKKDLAIEDIFNKYVDPRYTVRISCSTSAHMRKLSAINKLIFVAKYLNDGWVPDFKDYRTSKCCLCVDNFNNNRICIDYHKTTSIGVVYFKSEELAQQAIDILEEETIKQALSTDY